MTTEKTRMGKRKLRETPLKNRSPDSTPKKVKMSVSENNRSLQSSPVKDFCVEGVESSPVFATKCFYGLDKSKISNVKQNSQRRTPKSKPFTAIDEENRSSPCKFTMSGNKTFSPDSRVHEKMLERIAQSPMKQAVLETCSVEQFRRMYRGEFEAVEREVELESKPRTRRVSKIITRQDDDEENYDDMSDDEISFKVQNGGLDSDEIVEPTPRSMLKRSLRDDEINEKLGEESDEDNENWLDSSEEDVDSPKKLAKVDEGKLASTPASKLEKADAPSSSERKFFKTRSPLDNIKVRNIMFGKGFSLKFSSKPQNVRLTKKKSELKKKQLQKNSQVQGKKGNGLNSSSPLQMSTQTGFTFAPGFLSPKKSMDSACDEGNISDSCHEDPAEDLVFNKEGSRTYDCSPVIKSTCGLKLDSPSSLSENADLLEEGRSSPPSCRGTPVYHGSEELFSTEDSNSNVSGEVKGATHDENVGKSSSSRKLFPIFSKGVQQGKATPKGSPLTDKLSPTTPKSVKENPSQMILDAGQKKFGATQCPVCSMVYCHADPFDERTHAKFHKRLVDALKFPGWKNERVVQEYPMDMSRVILVMTDGPKYAKKKVEEIFQVMGRELGFPDIGPSFHNPYHRVFFYVSSEKQIEGCCVAEPISEGYRIIPDNLDDKEASGQRPWCCTKVAEPACVGISRLWVAASQRRSGVATKLVDCVLQWFEYGTLIPKHKVAFSDPTPDGRRFAQKYMGMPTFLVYKYHG
ncbi:N-acetyltransferase ESCO2 [Aplysia californica]|uniref:N-acetyltransferase ESCO2 n=1 Tax=Aplysia californica TaxID=6500 RepID=A0ABM0JU49_APLCA|nr:N-acetyltransferase ESCO2 [Aplysia californica]